MKVHLTPSIINRYSDRGIFKYHYDRGYCRDGGSYYSNPDLSNL